jgi:hypothetical protein
MSILMTAQQAADYLGYSPQSIRNWVVWGLLPSYHFTMNPSKGKNRPGRILVRKEGIEKALDEGRIIPK